MAEHILSQGYLLKKEKLATLESSVNHTELVLESLDPFPGFYDQYFVPMAGRDEKPGSLFLVTRDFGSCHEDEFIRINSLLRHGHRLEFDAALCTVQLHNQQVTAIRVHVKDYSQLSRLIGLYKEAGVKFQPSKQVKPYQGLIKIRRFFDLEKLADGIYKDCDKADTFFVSIPEFLTWDEFEKITVTIRNNCENKIYDAAQAAVYHKNGITELVRIYDRKASLENLQYLWQKYASESTHR